MGKMYDHRVSDSFKRAVFESINKPKKTAQELSESTNPELITEEEFANIIEETFGDDIVTMLEEGYSEDDIVNIVSTVLAEMEEEMLNESSPADFSKMGDNRVVHHTQTGEFAAAEAEPNKGRTKISSHQHADGSTSHVWKEPSGLHTVNRHDPRTNMTTAYSHKDKQNVMGRVKLHNSKYGGK